MAVGPTGRATLCADERRAVSDGLDQRRAPRNARVRGGLAARLPRPPPVRLPLPGRRHRRLLAAAPHALLAADPDRRRPHGVLEGARRHHRHLDSWQPRRVPAPLLRPAARQHHDHEGGDSPHRRRPPPSRPARGRVRRPERISRARLARRRGLRPDGAAQSVDQPDPAPAGMPLLEPVGLARGHAAVGAVVRRGVRGGRRARGSAAPGGRRRVRTHPPAGAAPGWLHPLLQLRRLGRELHRADRAFRRPTRARLVDFRGHRHARRDGGRRGGRGGVFAREPDRIRR